VSKLTEHSDNSYFNQVEAGGCCGPTTEFEDGRTMLIDILVTLTITYALGLALRSERDGQMIVKRPYNNRYNAASGAREDHLG
jgi:hypothetical protein